MIDNSESLHDSQDEDGSQSMDSKLNESSDEGNNIVSDSDNEVPETLK